MHITSHCAPLLTMLFLFAGGTQWGGNCPGARSRLRPISPRAIAAGLGYALNNYNQNILITQTNGTSAYNTIDAGINYDKNKLTLHFIELPIELRWRNSTPESHIFWRIYSGFKVSYLLYDRSIYEEGSETILVTQNKDLNPFQYGAYIAMGRNTWNLYAYYGLNTIFNKAQLGSQSIEMNTINFGLMFYIL